MADPHENMLTVDHSNAAIIEKPKKVKKVSEPKQKLSPEVKEMRQAVAEMGGNRKISSSEFRSQIVQMIADYADSQGLGRPDIRFVMGALANMQPFLIRHWNTRFPSGSQ